MIGAAASIIAALFAAMNYRKGHEPALMLILKTEPGEIVDGSPKKIWLLYKNLTTNPCNLNISGKIYPENAESLKELIENKILIVAEGATPKNYACINITNHTIIIPLYDSPRKVLLIDYMDQDSRITNILFRNNARIEMTYSCGSSIIEKLEIYKYKWLENYNQWLHDKYAVEFHLYVFRWRIKLWPLLYRSK